jgi:antitoxin ParD1/3/4
MPTRNVNLTDYYDQFVEQLVTSGRFSNASEVMRAGLRLLEQQTHEDAEKLAALRALASEGFSQLDQGATAGNEVELAELIGKIGRRAAENLK